jgi:DNA modification methylase
MSTTANSSRVRSRKQPLLTHAAFVAQTARKKVERRLGPAHGAMVPIEDLRLLPDNPRRGDVAAIAESLRINSQYRPIVVNSLSMEVLAGNHTLLAAKELGWTEIAVTFIEADPELARRIVLADNRTNDLAGYDNEALVALLGELKDFDGTGYDQGELDALLDELDRDKEQGDDASPPRSAKPKTKPGDLYQLGRHRLLCGDARDPGAYQRLLGDERIDMVWTDPPYGVEYEGKTAKALHIQGDVSADLADRLDASFAAADAALKRGARIYVCHPSGERARPFLDAFLSQGWKLRQELIWVKDVFVLGHADYHYRHESILYGNKPSQGRIGRGGQCWYGDDAQSSVLEVARPSASREHPTMKPPELIEIALRNSSRRSHFILDPFAGSGSTLIACEQSGRSSRLLEIDPGYCDVIVDRFETITGEKATRVLP